MATHEVSLGDLEELRGRARADSAVEAIALCSVGAAALLSVLVPVLVDGTTSSPLAWIVATLATPVAFAACWLAMRWRRRAVGVGTPTKTTGWLALALTLVSLLVPVIAFIYGPYPLLMGGLLLIGWVSRSRLLVLWAVIGGTLGTLAGLYFFGNRSGDLGRWTPHLDDAVAVGVAVVTLMLGVGSALRAHGDRR